MKSWPRTSSIARRAGSSWAPGGGRQRQRQRWQDQMLQPVAWPIPHPPATPVTSPRCSRKLDATARIDPQGAQDQQVGCHKRPVLSTSSASSVMTRSLSRYCRMAYAPITTGRGAEYRSTTSSRGHDSDPAPSSVPTGWPVMGVPKSPRTACDTQLAGQYGSCRKTRSCALASITACGGRGLCVASSFPAARTPARSSSTSKTTPAPAAQVVEGLGGPDSASCPTTASHWDRVAGPAMACRRAPVDGVTRDPDGARADSDA